MSDHLLGLCDSAAEALILIDLEDPTSVADLVTAFEALIEGFGDDLPGDHPAYTALWSARAVDVEGAPALSRCESAFLQVRKAAEKVADEGAAPDAATAASAAMPLAGDEELLRDFAIRSAEHLDDADEHLLRLERDPADHDAVDAVFRAFHTIKGMAGFLALDAISTHAHASESLLAEARAEKTALGAAAVHALFSAVDSMRTLVALAVPGTGAAGAAGGSGGAGGGSRSASGADDAGAIAAQEHLSAAAESARQGTVRVDEVRLDALLDTIGELVIAESMVSSSARGDADAALLAAQLERLDKITRELQHMATSLRMVPMRATFRRMARLVRDLATRAGKDVEFTTVGEDIELDKTVVDRIQDPLVHALRNAVDHGIESVERRRADGKPAMARVELRAFHVGGAIHVEVADDGAGLDPERILARGRALGLLGEGERPEDEALFELVYAPGFSTAETVTDVSGRGVGMDVVRRTVEELRGRIRLQSAPGEGTTVSIRLPVTLAIIDGMVCRVGDERYIVPVLAIERSVRPTQDQLTTVAGRGLLLATDDGLVPVVRLHELLGVAGAEPDPTRAVVVIVDEGGMRAGLLACELLGQQQTVIKPLGDGLADQRGITGGAIMPDGRVGLILDAAGLVRLAHGTE